MVTMFSHVKTICGALTLSAALLLSMPSYALDVNGDGSPPPPPMSADLENLQGGVEPVKTLDADGNKNQNFAINMRRDALKEAALSYGARGGLAWRTYHIRAELETRVTQLDKTFDFRQLLIPAPSGLLIEPPIVKESLGAMVITEGGVEAAVADQVLKINQQAKIVPTARNWRQYLVMNYESEITPPPRILWPKNAKEQGEWSGWVKDGWDAGFQQAEEAFETGLNQLTADYNGMVRYRLLLAEGKISQPYALHEDRGVTGGGNEMRVGDRALRITGPSQFLTGADLWKPADR